MILPLIYVKDHFPLVWNLVEFMNGKIFDFLYSDKITAINIRFLDELKLTPYLFRKLEHEDLTQIPTLINNTEPEKKKYFEPHRFDMLNLERVFKNPSFIMMGVFLNTSLVGYFFLRCFVNKKCFVGRLVDKDHRGKGIGKAMNQIMYNTAWASEFRCFATISKNNELVMKAHAKNDRMVIRKELANEHLLVEFVEKKEKTGGLS